MKNVTKSRIVKCIYVPEDLILDKKISDAAISCYTILVHLTNNKCKLINKEIAALMGKDVRSVRRYIRELVEAGYITSNRSLVNVYK